MKQDTNTPHRSPLRGHDAMWKNYVGIICTLFIFLGLALCVSANTIPSRTVISETQEETEEITVIKEFQTTRNFWDRYDCITIEEIEAEVYANTHKPIVEVVVVEKKVAKPQPVIKINTNLKVSDEAQVVWDMMIGYGWSPIISAGIIGNMMAEVGGHTFNLRWETDTGGYYGLCMWSKKYFPGIIGLNLEEQVEFLKNTLDMNIFKNCKTPEDAALAFAKYYERCSTRSYNKRKSNARNAYHYFA